MMYAATTERSIAMAILAIVVVAWAIYVFTNIRRSKDEVGSEVELAANRGSLDSDEKLEGSRLERVQAFGVLMLLIIALVLPIYWLREGGRRDEQVFIRAATGAQLCGHVSVCNIRFEVPAACECMVRHAL